SSVPGAVFEDWSDDQREVLDWAHALAIGPGLGRGRDRRALAVGLLAGRAGKPAIVDADGLNAFEDEPAALAELLTDADVITPHPGEMARLLRCSVPDIVDDPPGAVGRAVEAFGCTVVLKGTPTLIAESAGPVRVASTGGPALAVGGTGDVLSGAIGAYLAGGYPASDAASVASLLTGIAARAGGTVGLVAEDIPDAIPEARRALEALGNQPSDAVLFASSPASAAT
ncbi:MAG: NAD(P)H-hydrate dehydratase, partial [Gemmatimonadota bacterium]